MVPWPTAQALRITRVIALMGVWITCSSVSNDAESNRSDKTDGPHDWFEEGEPVVIRLMPEFGVDVPLFPQSDFTEALVPEDLLAKLISWQGQFLDNYVFETGRRSPDARDRFAADAGPLETALREALQGKAELEVDLWPVLEVKLFPPGDEPSSSD